MKKTFLLSSIFVLLLTVTGFAKKTNIPKEQKILIQTTAGNVMVKLYNQTPLHRDNFIKLVNSNFFDSVLFHRVISEFMIQGGDPNSKKALPDAMLGDGDVGYKIPAELKIPELFHKKGALAAAREGDNVNPEKASSGCQFYIVVGKIFTDKDLDMLQLSRKQTIRTSNYQKMMKGKQIQVEKYKHTLEYGKLKALNDSVMVQLEEKMKTDTSYIFTSKQREIYKTKGGTPHLDANYTVFGEIISGMDVVEKISKVKTNKLDRPIKDVRILKMTLIK